MSTISPLGGTTLAPRVEVFVSHSSADSPHVELIKQQIEALGITAYLAEHDVRPGAILNEKLKAAISRSAALIILITPNSLDSVIVQHEVGYATGKNILIVPLVLKGTDTSAMGFLNDLEYIELDPSNGLDTMIRLTVGLRPIYTKQVSGFSVALELSDPFTVLLLLGIGFVGGMYVASLLKDS